MHRFQSEKRSAWKIRRNPALVMKLGQRIANFKSWKWWALDSNYERILQRVEAAVEQLQVIK
jgi:hypothetical protein